MTVFLGERTTAILLGDDSIISMASKRVDDPERVDFI
jgi:hypothetical protein